MENKDKITSLFNRLQTDLNTAQPPEGHTMRFIEKLDASKAKKNKSKLTSILKPFIGIAAALLCGFALFTVMNQPQQTFDLASVSDEMATTQSFFYQTIENEIKKIDLERTPETEEAINDALNAIKNLEQEYESLKTDLQQSNSDKRVIFAMISNFQNRIEVLQTVIEQIENIKDFKHQSYENNKI